MSGIWNAGDVRKVFFLGLSFFFIMGCTNVSYFLPLYYEGQGYSIKAAGMLVSAFYITSVSLRPFLAGVVHAMGFRRLFIVAGVVAVLGSVGVACAGQNFWLGFASRAGLGAGSSLFQVGLATYQAMAFSERVRGRAFSLIMAGCLLPMMTMVPLADWFLHSGRPGLYILLPVAASAGALLFAPFIPALDTGAASPDQAKRRNPFRDLPELVRLPVFIPALLSFFLFCFTDATAAFMANMTAHYGLMASYFLSFNALVGVAVRIFCAGLLDRYPRWALAAPSVLITAGTLLLASFNPTPASLVVLGLVFGVGMGFGFPLHLALVSDGVPAKLQPQAVSLSWFFMGLDFALVPMLMGWMGNLWGPVAAFRALCVFALAGTALSVALWWRVRRV